MDYQALAEKALKDECPTREECRAVLEASDEAVPELVHAAWRVRKARSGRKVHLHMLVNAKSGLCEEDCHYCSQSSISKAPIEQYPLFSTRELIDGARRAMESGALRYCIVISGRGPRPLEMERITDAVKTIKKQTPLSICCSLGLLTPEDARTLKAAGVDRINHNLNTSERFYGSICSTHTYGDRIATLDNARAAGIELCSGGIVGMGESGEDIIDMAMALREVRPESIPVNFLTPIEETPLAPRMTPRPLDCLRILCLFRFLHPRSELRIAGGRERGLRTLQSQALYVADSIFVDGYLTTPGQTPGEARQMIEDLGFEIVEPAKSPTR